MSIPKVAIIGRPNVGKSSLFNWLLGERVSIVDPTAGVTRDRVTALLELNPNDGRNVNPDSLSDRLAKREAAREFHVELPKWIELTDTGGIGIVDEDNLSEHVEEQIQFALGSADLILFVTSARDGIVSLDEEIMGRLRKLPTPVLLVVNKADSDRDELLAAEFLAFGWEPIPVSAKQKRGRVALMQAVEETLDTAGFFTGDVDETIPPPEMKVAIVGRQNVGKSTFINTLTQEERVIASPVPGTTRDSIDVRFELDGKTFVAIDTPGFQRKKGVKTDLEFYSTTRAERSIRMADVVLLFFDASQRLTKADRQLVQFVEEQYKPCIFVVNKWDTLIGQQPTEVWAEYLRDNFPNLWHVPIAFITGKTGKNIKKLLNHATMLFKQSHSRVNTSFLNKLVIAALDYNPPPLFHYRKVKIYYATQVDVSPPTIVLFCNMPDAFTAPYQRYLLGVLRDELEFGEVPIRILFRKRESDDGADDVDSHRKS